MSKKLIDVITIGAVGGLAIFLANTFQLPAWVLFIGWVSYYAFGKTPKNAINTFALLLGGILLAMAVKYTGIFLTPYLGAFGLPVAVFFLVGSLGLIRDIKWIGNLLAYFLGMIAFFGSHLPIEGTTIFVLSIPLALGLTFAWVLDSLQNMIRGLKVFNN